VIAGRHVLDAQSPFRRDKPDGEASRRGRLIAGRHVPDAQSPFRRGKADGEARCAVGSDGTPPARGPLAPRALTESGGL